MDAGRFLGPAAGLVLALCPGAAGAMTPIPDPAPSGPEAIAAANRAARTASFADRFEAGVQVFAYAPGRIYEVWTAPLRVTALTLSPGERVTDLAAGDTVRWKIGTTSAGDDAGARAIVLVKPLERGLETNLVLTTSQRIYLMQLRSGGPGGFNAAVAWTPPPQEARSAAPSAPVEAGAVLPIGALDARFSIRAPRRRPAWTPLAVMTDGVRTYLAFPPQLGQGEAPALFAIGADGGRRMVNYRQAGALYIVDQVLERAELVDGARRPRRVEIVRLGGARHER